MLDQYAENRGTVQAIRDGIKFFRRGVETRKKEELTSEKLTGAIISVKKEYRKLRLKGLRLWWKLHHMINTVEILRACEAYKARCREIQRRHKRE